MRKLIHCLALMTVCLVVVETASATRAIPFDDTDSIVVPPDSPVHFAGFNSDPNKAAVFQGGFLLTGTYYYGDHEFNDSGDDSPSDYVFVPQAYIVPDDDLASRLPRFAVHDEREIIFISNPAAFARAVVPAAESSRVSCRHCGDATGQISIWVDQFSAGIECDNSYYEVRFLSVYKSPVVASAPRPRKAC